MQVDSTPIPYESKVAIDMGVSFRLAAVLRNTDCCSLGRLLLAGKDWKALSGDREHSRRIHCSISNREFSSERTTRSGRNCARLYSSQDMRKSARRTTQR